MSENEAKKKTRISPLALLEAGGAAVCFLIAASMGWTTYQQFTYHEAMAQADSLRMRMGKGYAPARARITSVRDIGADEVDYHLLHGAINLLDFKTHKAAKAAFAEALKVDPRSGPASLGVGVATLYEAAAPELPDADRQALVETAISAIEDGGSTVAATVNAACAEVLRDPKDDKGAKRALALFDEAQAALDGGEAVPLQVAIAFHYNRAVVALRVGDYALAFRSLTTVVQLNPGTFAPYPYERFWKFYLDTTRRMLTDRDADKKDQRDGAFMVESMLKANLVNRLNRTQNKWGLGDQTLRRDLWNATGIGMYHAGEYKNSTHAFGMAVTAAKGRGASKKNLRDYQLNRGMAWLQRGRSLIADDEKAAESAYRKSLAAFRDAVIAHEEDETISYVALTNSASLAALPPTTDLNHSTKWFDYLLKKSEGVKGTEREAEVHRRLGVTWEWGKAWARAIKEYRIAIDLQHKDAFELEVRIDRLQQRLANRVGGS